MKRLFKSLASLCKVQLLMFETVDNKNKFCTDNFFLYIQFWDSLAITNHTDWLKYLWFVTGMFAQMKGYFQQEGPCIKDVSCPIFFIFFPKVEKGYRYKCIIYLIIRSKYFPISDQLVNTTCIIHNNQLLLTKFGNNFVISWTDDIKMTSKVQPGCRLLNRWPRKPGDVVELFW